MDAPSRPFRGRAFLLALVLSLAACRTTSTDPGIDYGPWVDGPPRYVFLVIGDGMGESSEVAASRFLYGADAGLAWHSAAWTLKAFAATWDVTTYNHHAAQAGAAPYDAAAFDPELGYDPVQAGAEPWPLALSSDGSEARTYLLGAATDSAAAATALATGRKTEAGRIAWSPGSPSSALIAITMRARYRRGASFGAVSTVPFNHATPAAFLAHSQARADYAAIAGEIILGTRPELVIGGGHPGWNTDYAGVYARGLLLSESGYLLVGKSAGRDGGAALLDGLAGQGPGIGLFGYFGGADGSLEAPFPLDSPGSPAFTRGSEDPSLAASVAVAARSLARNPRGFVLVVEQGDIDWANHANDFPRMLGAMRSLDEAVRAIESFIDQPGDAIDWGNSLVVVTADHATGLLRFASSSVIGMGSLPSSHVGGTWQYPGGTVSYNTTGHANELVSVSVRGDEALSAFSGLAGARWPGTSIVDNTDIYRAISRFLGFE